MNILKSLPHPPSKLNTLYQVVRLKQGMQALQDNKRTESFMMLMQVPSSSSFLLYCCRMHLLIAV